MKNNVGVLLPVSSLPGRHGIGDFGPTAYKFVDWLAKHHYRYWQVLPLNPVGPGYSPYMSTCSEAIETRYISLDVLTKQGLIRHTASHRPHAQYIDYYDVDRWKDKYLWKAYQKFLKTKMRGYQKFKKDNPWLTSYATYIIFHNENNMRPWNEWTDEQIHYFENHSSYPEDKKELAEFYIFLQFIAHKQWMKLWNYAKKKGIIVIADCPFYVGIDSTDCWLHKEQFLMDEKYNPTMVSGVPPDCFSDDGQLWGTPIFDFEVMKKDNYQFLVDRLGSLAKTCDYLRLDHFRAFDTYCVIPAEDENARRGKWEIGPRYDFFDALYKKYPDIKLIAEDLGDLFQGVHDLRDHYKLPGMFIMEFCVFDIHAESKPSQLVYPGTHDNQTLEGWFKTLPPWNKTFLKNRFPGQKDLVKAVFEHTWNVPSLMTIFPLQDLLRFDDRARLNWPGTVGSPNWTWKLKDTSWINKIKLGQ